MRVVAGEARGRKILVPLGRDVRPTSDRVREAVFSSLGRAVVEARVLDLFAGSGALGIEALSRGARSAAFVERSRRTARTLEANISTLGLSERASLTVGDAMASLRRFDAAGRSFDLVFLDPPYDSGELPPLLDALAATSVLPSGGLIVAEHRSGEELRGPRGLRIRTVKRYGGTSITTLVKQDPE